MDVGRGFTPAVNPPQPVILSGAKNLTYFCNVGLRPDPSRALEDDTFGVGRKVAQDEKHPPVILSEAKNLTYAFRNGGRDALRKYASGIFLAKVGSKLCLRPGPKGKPPPYILKYWFTHTAKCSKIKEPPLV